MITNDTFEPHGFKRFTAENWQTADMPHYFPNITPDKWIEGALQSKLAGNVPKDIRAMFEVARGAIIHGWYFYPLVTLGHEQLNRVQEAAAHARCEQLKITPSKVIKS
ncbi:MAG: hypothetical protein WCS42_17135 [Verrucomicrobiota bacterium]